MKEHGDIMAPVTFSLVAVGLNGYTDDTLPEFLFRVRLLERCGLGVTDRPLPLEYIQRWAGITTNVAPKTRTRFLNDTRHELVREVERAVAREHT